MSTSSDLLRRLEAQSRASWLRLRFAPDLEQSFLADHLRSIVRQRLALLAAGILLVAVTPLAENLYLHPPEPMVAPLRWAQFGVMIPVLLIASIVTAVPALRRWADPVGMLAAFLAAAGIIFQRALGAPYGFVVPTELVGVVFAGTAILAGFRFVHFAPLAVLVMALFVGVEASVFGPGPLTWYTSMALGMLAIIAVLGSYMQEHAARAAWLQRRMLEELAVHDPLTGVLNGRGFQNALPPVFAAAARDRRPLLVAAVDIDHFKAFNDYYGHLAGDTCLQRVAESLSRLARRATDIRARTGGEEFVLVCYDVAPAEAAAMLEELRLNVEKLAIPHAASPQAPGVVTVSIGAVCRTPVPGSKPEVLLQAADTQLYLSKQQGRNRVSLQAAGPAESAAVHHAAGAR